MTAPDSKQHESHILDGVPAEYPEARTVFLGGIFFMMLLAALHVASDLFIPIVLAFLLKLVFLPVQRGLERIRLPRVLAALVVVALFAGGVAGLAYLLSGPVSGWADKLSDSFPRIQQKLAFLSEPISSAQKIAVNAENIAAPATPGVPKVLPVAVQGTRLFDRIFTGSRNFISGLCTMMLVFFFLLAAGDTFLRRVVEILPRFRDKRQAVDISQQIQQDISGYLLTITCMNALVGTATGFIMAACGRADPLLWGCFAFLLNYVPVLGPITGFGMFLLAGLLLNQPVATAVLPAALYLGVHTLESSFITPMLLARRFTLNPVLVILSLVFWYWLWGFAGAILAMPMLAITKIVCDRVTPLRPFGHFLAGDKPI